MSVCFNIKYLVCVIVTNDALVFGQAELAALVSCQGKGGQERWPQCIVRGIVIGN